MISPSLSHRRQRPPRETPASEVLRRRRVQVPSPACRAAPSWSRRARAKCPAGIESRQGPPARRSEGPRPRRPTTSRWPSRTGHSPHRSQESHEGPVRQPTWEVAATSRSTRAKCRAQPRPYPRVRDAHLPATGVHILRHTCATLLISQGAPVKAIQAQLGHASPELTLGRYGHLYPDDLDALAARLDTARASAVKDYKAQQPDPPAPEPPGMSW